MVSTRLTELYNWWRPQAQVVAKTSWSDIRWAVEPLDSEVNTSEAAQKLREEGAVVLAIDVRGFEAEAGHADDIYAVARSRNIHPVLLTSFNPLDWAAFGFDVEFIPEGEAAQQYVDQVIALWGAAGMLPLAGLVKTARLLPQAEPGARRKAREA